MVDDIFAKMAQTVLDGEAELAAELAQQGLDAGLAAVDILDLGFVVGIEEVGDLFARGEFFLPELVQGAEAMKAAVAVLQPGLDASDGRKVAGVAVAGTVAATVETMSSGAAARGGDRRHSAEVAKAASERRRSGLSPAVTRAGRHGRPRWRAGRSSEVPREHEL